MAETTQRNQPWIGLLALFTAASLVDAAFYGQVAAFTPLHLESLGLTPEQVTRDTGILAALPWLVGIPFLPLWGALADRYSRQPVIARSFVAFLVAGGLMLAAREVWLFGLGRAVMSFALGNSGLMMTTLAERVPKERLGLAFAIMNSAAPIGYFAGPLAGGPVVDGWGFRTLLLVNMGLVLLVTIGITFGYRDPYRGTASGSLWRMAAGSVVIIWRSPGLRAVFGAIFALFVGWQAALPYVPLAVTEVYRGSDPGTAVGLVVGVGGLATILFGPAMGALADRHGRWRVLFAGAALSVLLLPLPALTRSVTGLTATWGLANGVVSGLLALSFALLPDATHEDTRGRVMAFAWLPVNASGAVGPAIGSVAAHFSVWWVFPVAAALTGVGIGAMALAERRVRVVTAEAEDIDEEALLREIDRTYKGPPISEAIIEERREGP